MPTDTPEFTYDVFQSHCAKDKAVVRPLAERLWQDGVKVRAGTLPRARALHVGECTGKRGWRILSLLGSESELCWKIVKFGNSILQAKGLPQASPGQARNERRPGSGNKEWAKPQRGFA